MDDPLAAPSMVDAVPDVGASFDLEPVEPVRPVRAVRGFRLRPGRTTGSTWVVRAR